MKKSMFKLCLVAIVSLWTAVAQAQNIEAVPERIISKNAIESQMGQIMVNSADYKDVKLVKTTSLEELHSDVATLLSRNENDLSNSKTIIEHKNSEIKKLKAKVEEAKLEASAAVVDNDTFLLFGMQVSKTTYHAIMWTLVLTLLIAVCFLTVRFRKANEITHNSKAILIEVEDELETFKRNAIEREQKLRRQLQDELNRRKMLEAS